MGEAVTTMGSSVFRGISSAQELHALQRRAETKIRNDKRVLAGVDRCGFACRMLRLAGRNLVESKN